MYSLVMRPFSNDFLKIQFQQDIICILLLPACTHCLHRAWFLDGRTPMLVVIFVNLTIVMKIFVMKFS